MSFNKNACKRLCLAAGVERGSHDLPNIINKMFRKFLEKIVSELVNVVLFTGRKTATVADIAFLSKVCPDRNTIVCPNNFNKLAKICTDHDEILDDFCEYALYTVKKPFKELIQDFVAHASSRQAIRLAPNVYIVLQNMAEQHVINVIHQAKQFADNEDRDTLLVRDLRGFQPP